MPRLTTTLSAPDSTDYPAWKEAVVEERTFTPDKAGYGSLEVVVKGCTVLELADMPTFVVAPEGSP